MSSKKQAQTREPITAKEKDIKTTLSVCLPHSAIHRGDETIKGKLL